MLFLLLVQAMLCTYMFLLAIEGYVLKYCDIVSSLILITISILGILSINYTMVTLWYSLGCSLYF